MKLNLIMIAVFISIAIFVSSCGSDYRKSTGALEHTNGDGLNHAPSHIEMIAIEGDKCPKYDYMTIIPISWSL